MWVIEYFNLDQRILQRYFDASMEDVILSEPSARKARYRGSYNFDIHQVDDATNEDCPMEVDDAREMKAPVGSAQLRELGITVVDLLRHDLSSSDKRGQLHQDTKEWLNERGSVELLELCDEWCDSPAFKELVCKLATKFLKTEFKEFTSSQIIHQSTQKITSETLTNFSLQALSDTITMQAPYLLGLFKGLLGVDDQTPISPDTPTSSLNPRTNKGEVEMEQWRGSDDGQEAEPLSDNEDLRSRDTKPQTVRWVTAFSIMCYTKTRKANLYQMVMGYYLISADTSKCVLEVLHAVGFSVSYSSVTRMMKTIAQQSIADLQTIPSKYPRFSFCFDNMDFQARVRDLAMDHQGCLKHYCAAYAAINLDGGSGPMLTADDINMLRATQISASDILLSDYDQKWYQNAWHFSIYSVLQAHCGESILFTTTNGKQLKAVPLFSIHQIPRQKTLVWVFPVFARNESIMSEISDLFRDIMELLGLKRDEIEGMKIFAHGDLFTVIRSRLSLS